MNSPIHSLKQVRDHCAVGQHLPSDLRVWLAHSLERYLSRDCASLNQAFGLSQGHGGIPWWRERAIRERDRALRALSERHLSAIPPRERARAIVRLSERYASTCWPRDRRHQALPEHYRGTPKEFLWRAFRSGAKMPLGERRLRTLLTD